MVTLAHPSADLVRAARAATGMTSAEAAARVHRANYRRWSEWENGNQIMPLAEWELFVMKSFPRTQWKEWLVCTG